jgi:hypothetical protein
MIVHRKKTGSACHWPNFLEYGSVKFLSKSPKVPSWQDPANEAEGKKIVGAVFEKMGFWQFTYCDFFGFWRQLKASFHG